MSGIVSNAARTNENNALVANNYCEVFAQLVNQSNSAVMAFTALKGRTVNVGVNYDSSEEMFRWSADKQPEGGLLYKIQQEIARRGQFAIKYVPVTDFAKFNSSTQFLQSVTKDVLVDIYGGSAITDTGIRRDDDLDFTTRVVDDDVMMVTRRRIINEPTFFSFADPFDTQLWMVLFGVVVAYGLFHYLLEHYGDLRERELPPKATDACASASASLPVQAKSMDDDQPLSTMHRAHALVRTTSSRMGAVVFGPSAEEDKAGLGLSVYAALMKAFNGDAEVEPVTAGAGIMHLGFRFFVFILAACYSANLANIYIKAQVSHANINLYILYPFTGTLKGLRSHPCVVEVPTFSPMLLLALTCFFMFASAALLCPLW